MLPPANCNYMSCLCTSVGLDGLYFHFFIGVSEDTTKDWTENQKYG